MKSWFPILLFICARLQAVTLDHFNCQLKYGKGDGEAFRTQSSVWVIRYPGSCERNAYCISYANADFSMKLDGDRVQAKLSLIYKHATDSLGLKGAQWACLNANAQVKTEQGTVSIKNHCEPHGSDPFSPDDKNWLPVPVTKGIPAFDPKALLVPVSIISTELGSELAVHCEYLESKTKD